MDKCVTKKGNIWCLIIKNKKISYFLELLFFIWLFFML